MGAKRDVICAKHKARFGTGYSDGTDTSKKPQLGCLSENQRKDHIQRVCNVSVSWCWGREPRASCTLGKVLYHSALSI